MRILNKLHFLDAQIHKLSKMDVLQGAVRVCERPCHAFCGMASA